MVSTETVVVGVGVAAVAIAIVWVSTSSGGSDPDSDSRGDSSSGPNRSTSADDGPDETTSVETTGGQSRPGEGSASPDSGGSGPTPSSSSVDGGDGADADSGTSSGGSTRQADRHRDDTSPRQETTASSTDSDADDDGTTRLYDPSTESQQGPQVWLHIEGEQIELPDGTAIGSELRRHLVDQGVSEQQALAVSRNHFMVRTTDSGVKLQDLDSTGGTVLEGSRLTPRQWVSLDDGDEIVLAGQLRGRFEIG